MKLREMLNHCYIQETSAIDDKLEVNILKVTQDTRQVEPGSLFIAIKGAKFDGHRFLDQAIKAGAVAVVVEEKLENSQIPYVLVNDTKKAMAQLADAFYGNPSQKLKIVGITGTNGKTTVTNLVEQISEELGKKTGIIGTMYNKILDQEIPTLNTTPDSLTLQALFHEMNEKEVDVCAMEVSSHGLVQGRVWGTDFDVAVFTNLSQDHLDYHITMDNYFKAKSLLFSQLGNTYTGQKKLAVINIDDAHGEELCQYTAADVLTYGSHGKGNLQAKQVEITATGTKFILGYHHKEYALETKLVGDFNIYNLLAAIGACLGLGYSIEEILSVVSKVKPVKGRFELIENSKGVSAIVDYAHTPDGLENVLETIKKIATKRIICVVGCGGDRDKTKRPLMADIAIDYADLSIFTSDNPRTEDPDEIVQDMVRHLDKQAAFKTIVDRKKAIQEALKLAEPGDFVLVAGKGHENYQIIGTVKNHFDDGEIISEYRS